MRTKSKFKVSRAVLHFIFILLSLVCVVPLLLVVGVSFTEEKTLLVEGYNLIPKVFSTEAYKFVFAGAASIGQAYLVTIIVTVVGTFCHILFMGMLAYSLTREEVTARNKISLFVYLPVLFQGGWYHHIF